MTTSLRTEEILFEFLSVTLGLETEPKNIKPGTFFKKVKYFDNEELINFIKPYFRYGDNEVCKRLGICSTSLKKVCREVGIDRWPSRKFKGILYYMANDPDQSIGRRKYYDDLLLKLEADPNIPFIKLVPKSDRYTKANCKKMPNPIKLIRKPKKKKNTKNNKKIDWDKYSLEFSDDDNMAVSILLQLRTPGQI